MATKRYIQIMRPKFYVNALTVDLMEQLKNVKPEGWLWIQWRLR